MYNRLGRFALAAAVMAVLAMVPARAQGACDGVSPVTPTSLKAVAVASGLTAPVQVVSPPGDADRVFIVQQSGEILIKRRGDPPATTTSFLDIPVLFGGETGLLSLAFDPDFGSNRFFYVFHSESAGGSMVDSVVTRYTVSATNPDAVVNNSDVELMRFRKPQQNHNGGQLLFGEDGFLYVFTGDGGGRDDEGTGHAACGNGQALDTLLGKILRIDVGGGDPAGTAPDTTCMANFTASTYNVPSDNPFVDGAGGSCDEIWALGLRNPWRASFDSATGDLYIGDAGQDCQEEVDRVTPAGSSGANYGWRVMEGKNCFDPINPTMCATLGVMCGSSPLCNDPGLTNPVLAYNHPTAICGGAVIGGFVYRGCRMPALGGTYFYGDNCKGWVRSFELDGGGLPTNENDWTAEFDPVGSFLGITAFGVDDEQEIYIADAQTGEVLKILPLFTDFEVAGPGAGSPLLVAGSGSTWTWEDLEFSSMHPVDYYRVYRGVPNGTFSCIHSTLDPEWVGGDPANPAAGQLFAYIVTAVSGAEETASGDPPRTLINPCPAP